MAPFDKSIDPTDELPIDSETLRPCGADIGGIFVGVGFSDPFIIDIGIIIWVGIIVGIPAFVKTTAGKVGKIIFLTTDLFSITFFGTVFVEL